MKKIMILVLLIMSIYNVNAQDAKLIYQPVQNVNQEEVWPLVYRVLNDSKIGLLDFNYGQNTMTSNFHEYIWFISSKCRVKYIFRYENSTLYIDPTQDEMFDLSPDGKSGAWVPSHLASKHVDKVRAILADGIRAYKNNPQSLDAIKSDFYNSLNVTQKFFTYATELAGERWFETYLKNKKVNRQPTFVDMKIDNVENYKYSETYVFATNSALTSGGLEDNFFFIVKNTNSENNIFAQKGATITVQGYCQLLTLEGKKFFVQLTDDPDTKISFKNNQNAVSNSNTTNTNNNSSLTSKADELIKLKELLDKGIITKEEYDEEKKKILSK